MLVPYVACSEGLLAGFYDIPESALAKDVFPDSADARPMRDLIA